MKKAIKELEEEGKVKFEILKGKGISVKFLGEKQKTTEEPPNGKKGESEKEEKLKKKVSLQDRVLKSLIGKEVKIFLISGTRLEGTLLDFDNFTLSITAPKGKSLIYKHAVATILYE
jgi:RNA chaperone Hfq